MIDERDFFLHFNEFKKYVEDAELYKTIIDALDCEFDKILSEKKNV